jgi:hypothetical protein
VGGGLWGQSESLDYEPGAATSRLHTKKDAGSKRTQRSSFLAQRWSHQVAAHSQDFTDQEAVAIIIRITKGNMRLIARLMKQVERVLTANQLTVVTKEVVETTHQNLIIGFE